MRVAVAVLPLRELTEDEKLGFGRDLWNAVIPYLDPKGQPHISYAPSATLSGDDSLRALGRLYQPEAEFRR